jgi:ribosomal protein S18 acetylase RimI-like enzyme
VNPDLQLRPALDFSPEQLHAAFGAAFSDYLAGPFNLPFSAWPVFVGRQCVDLAASRVAVLHDAIAAFAFVAPRADNGGWRLATMGAVPASRGSGAAPKLLDDFILRAMAAGAHHVELECFAQNERALRLYKSRRFEVVHELWGYARAARPEVDMPPAEVEAQGAVAIEDAYAWLDDVARRRGDLPLQVTTPSLRAQPVELQALRAGRAQLVYGEAAPGKLVIHSLVDHGSPDLRDSATVVETLLQKKMGHDVNVPQLQRRDLGGGALEALGFERLPLHQVYMRKALARD